jgi:hypothetical protein
MASGSHAYVGAVSGFIGELVAFAPLTSVRAEVSDAWVTGYASDPYNVGGPADAWQAGAVE